MIPLSIELENFRSFKKPVEIPLDFAPLFCIVGENGAGKSSIVEAILWALFGKSRENVRGAIPIRTGEKSVRVRFDFEIEGQRYRIIRSNGSDGHKISFLKLNESNEYIPVIRSHRISDIQRMIEEFIGADYQGLRLATVFVQNESAIFSTISPSERRRVLARLLGIERYEVLRKKAGKQIRYNEAAMESLRSQLEIIKSQLAEIPNPADELKRNRLELEKMKSKLSELEKKLSDNVRRKTEIDSIFQKKEVLERALQSRRGEAEHIFESLKNLKHQKSELEKVIENEEEILKSKNEYDEISSRAKELSSISAERATILENIDIIKQKINSAKSRHNEKINRLNGEIAQIENEIEEARGKIADVDFLRKKLNELHFERQILEELSSKKQKFEELNKAVIQARTEIDAEKRNIREQIQQFEIQREKIEDKLSQLPILKKRSLDIQAEIQRCEQNLEEIGRIREQIVSVDFEIENRVQKVKYLRDTISKKSEQLEFIENQKISRCPLCGSELTDKHKAELVEKLSSEIKISQTEMMKIEEEIRQSRLHRNKLDAELEEISKIPDLKDLKHKYEKISIEIASLEKMNEQFDEINGKIEELRGKLRSGNFANKWRSILRKINKNIMSLDFDMEIYSKVKKMVDELSGYEKKWEIANEYIRKAESLGKKLENSKNKLRELLKISVASDLEERLRLQIEKLNSLNYDADEFEQIHKRLDELRDAPNQFFRLQQAKDNLPEIEYNISKLENRYNDIQKEILRINSEISEIEGQVSRREVLMKKIDELQNEIDKLNSSISDLNEHRAELKSDLKSFNNLNEQYKKLNEQLRVLQKESRLHGIVEKILGPMGIQNWLLKGYLKNLEENANDTLSLLSENTLRVRLVPEGDEKLIIHISDNLGERIYESYSGGEEFRIDFSIRLALSRLLAKRAGFPLQTLIIDEGFGSQDQTGLSNLVDALYQVQSQFARIIVVTHLTSLQNAFPARLEVKKNELESTVRVIT